MFLILYIFSRRACSALWKRFSLTNLLGERAPRQKPPAKLQANLPAVLQSG
jgi:hypothetical protein